MRKNSLHVNNLSKILKFQVSPYYKWSITQKYLPAVIFKIEVFGSLIVTQNLFISLLRLISSH